jgi:hypothetical protein
VIESQINQKFQKIPLLGNILEILGIGKNILSRFLINPKTGRVQERNRQRWSAIGTASAQSAS